MKRASVHRILLTLVFTCVANASTWEIGIITGAAFPWGDFGYYWRPSPCAGIGITYPFHPRLPITLSCTGSRHLPALPDRDINGYTTPTKKVALLDFRLDARYRLLRHAAFSPVLNFGFDNSMFIAYHHWDPLNDQGETELGVHAGAGVERVFGCRVRMAVGYSQNVVFSDPQPVWYGSIRLETSIRLHQERSHGSESSP